MYALHACPKVRYGAWGTSMYLDIKFHQYVTYVLAGCLENIFWNYRKLGLFVRSNCYPCATVVRWIVCCVNTLCLSALPLFVHYPQGMCSVALSAHAGIVPGSLCCLNPFGTCLEFLLNIRADHSTTVCVLQQPYNQQSPCSATPLWKQRFDIGSTI